MRRLPIVRVLAVAAAVLLLTAATAQAIGTGGVELLPQLPRGRDGRFILEVGSRPATAEVLLENLTTTSTQVRVYAVAATVTARGDASLGAPDSAPWLGLEEGTVELAPREQRRVQFTVEPDALPANTTHAAIVLESRQGPTLITRVASVLRLTGGGSSAPQRWVLLMAVALLVVATGALTGQAGRDRTRRRSALVGSTAG